MDNKYIDFEKQINDKQINDKDPKFKVVDHVRISKYKTFLLKDIIRIGLKRFL